MIVVFSSTFHGSLRRVEASTHPLVSPITRVRDKERNCAFLNVLHEMIKSRSPSLSIQLPNGDSTTHTTAPVLAIPVTSAAPPPPQSSFIECILCEKEVTLKLLPCQHEVLCTDCVQRAKRCPECKVSPLSLSPPPPSPPPPSLSLSLPLSPPPFSLTLSTYYLIYLVYLSSSLSLQAKVEGFEDITKCPMCEEEVATVTLIPCQHKLCPGNN